MKSHSLRRLLSSSATYAIANLLQRGMMLILLPLYARHFSKAEFGAMDMLYQSILVLALLSSLGMPQGLPRGLYREGTTEEDSRRLIGVLTVFVLPVTVLLFVCIWVFSGAIATLLFNNQGEEQWIRLAGALFVAMVLQQYPLQILKAHQRALEYSLWSIGTFVLASAGNVYLIVFKQIGLSGMLIGNSVGFGLMGLLACWRCRSYIRWNTDWSRLRPLLAFGLPMMPALLGRKVLEISDRYMLPHYHTLEALGDYVMAAKVSNIVEVLVLTPFLFAWQPFFYSIAKRAEAKAIFARVTLFFVSVAAVVFMVLYIVHDELLRFIGNGQYNDASPVILVLVLTALVNGVQYTISPGIHIASKLPQESGLMLTAAALNIGLNFLLIPPYGAVGAAVATLLSYLAYLVSTFVLAQTHFRIAYHWRRMTWVFCTAVVAVGCMAAFRSPLVQVFFLLCFLLVGPGVDIYRHERDLLTKLWQRIHPDRRGANG